MTTGRKRKLLWTCGVLLALAALLTPLFVELFRQKRLLEVTFTQYANAVVARDYPKAYGFLGPDLHRVVTLAKFSEQQSLIETEFGGVSRINFSDVELEGNGSDKWTGSLRAKFIHVGRESVFDFYFRSDGKTWTIQSYQQQ